MFAIAILLSILQTTQITLGGHVISVEIADTPKTQEKGLMGRKQLPPNTGMLFVFKRPQILAFWMKDTLIPLSLAYFDENKKLIEMIDMPVVERGSSPPTYFRSSKPALYALEVPEHWFQENDIKVDMEFSFLDRSDRLESSECEKIAKNLGESSSPLF